MGTELLTTQGPSTGSAAYFDSFEDFYWSDFEPASDSAGVSRNTLKAPGGRFELIIETMCFYQGYGIVNMHPGCADAHAASADALCPGGRSLIGVSALSPGSLHIAELVGSWLLVKSYEGQLHVHKRQT